MTLETSTAVEALGWAATATFVGSYLARRAETLVRVQIAGALLWAVYGVLVRSAPVVAANLLVMAAGAWKARASRRGAASGGGEGAGPPAALTPEAP